MPADVPELSKEEAKLLDKLPDAPKTVISPEAVRTSTDGKPALAQRRAASQEEPLAA